MCTWPVGEWRGTRILRKFWTSKESCSLWIHKLDILIPKLCSLVGHYHGKMTKWGVLDYCCCCNNHKGDVLKWGRFNLLWFWSSDVCNQGVGRAAFLLKADGKRIQFGLLQLLQAVLGPWLWARITLPFPHAASMFTSQSLPPDPSAPSYKDKDPCDYMGPI